MTEKKFSSERLKLAIKGKYGSLTTLANILGITKQGLDAKLNKPSFQFIRQLVELGVINENALSDSDRMAQIISNGSVMSNQAIHETQIESGSDEMVQVHNNFSGKGHKITVIDKNVTDEVCKNCDTRKMLETQIEQLREIIKAKDEIIVMLKKGAGVEHR